jgi:hypothetical protein
MKLIESIKQYFEKKTPNIEAPDNHCPNCWGRQEYEGKFLEALHQEKIDLNNLNDKQGWIQAYATEHFEGIKSKAKDSQLVCNMCKISYQA